MIKKIELCLFVVIFSMLSGNVSASICYCDSCASCTAKINDPACIEIRLTANIINHSGTCINNPVNFNNKIFDCQGHIIDGIGQHTGIYLNIKHNNTIKNCVITEFEWGVVLEYSSNNNVTNNTMNNSRFGIYLWASHSNVFYMNTFKNSRWGLAIDFSKNNNIINNIVSNNRYGFYLYNSSNGTINNNIVNNNSYAGITLLISSNILTNNTICRNTGWDVDSDTNAFGTNNMCGKVRNFRDHGYYLCSFMCPGEDPNYWWFLMILPAIWYLYYFRKRKRP